MQEVGLIILVTRLHGPVQIMFTELGDETFIIAAIMAMRHPRLVVYAGAMAALASMTVNFLLQLPVISFLVPRHLIPCPAHMQNFRHAS